MEQMRVLVVARRSAREQRIQSLNQIRHLVFTAPEPIRARFLGRNQKGHTARTRSPADFPLTLDGLEVVSLDS